MEPDRRRRVIINTDAKNEGLLDLMGLQQQVTVANGAPTGIPDEQTPLDSDGAQLIIAESNLATTAEPLFAGDIANALSARRKLPRHSCPTIRPRRPLPTRFQGLRDDQLHRFLTIGVNHE